MKLCHSPLSPFVRRVVLTARHHNLLDQIDFEDSDHSDMFKGNNPSNPLGKIPSLTLDNGDVLFDSIVICEYLDSIGSGPKLFPAAGPERWKTLTLHAMADGMTDACYQRRVDGIMPEGEGSPSWNARLKVAIESCLDAMEKQADGYNGVMNIGTIAVAVALGYHDFRFSAEQWRNGRPKLETWYHEFAKLPAFAETVPAG